jgi:hypothetical protein
MTALNLETTDGAPRRNFFTRLAGATAFGIAGLLPAASGVRAAMPSGDGLDWPGKLKGRHRQLVDGYSLNGGGPLMFTYTFLATNTSAGAGTAVLVLRAGAFPIALNNAIWEKYRIGESMKIVDPATKAAAMKNPFLQPKSGVLPFDEMAIDRLLGAGAVVGACNFALHGQSRKLASIAGVSAEEAAKEWAANLVPGIMLIPSGTWGVNRAQETGCTYCSGG